MKEKNKRTLRDALDRLPEYGADAGAWKAIEAGLSPPLRDALPSYQPPASVWNGLSRELSAAPEPAAKRRSLWPRIGGVAAAILLLVSLGLGLGPELFDGGPTVRVAYSQEVAPAASQHDWDDGEESFEKVIAQIEARNEPALNALYHELAELTEAKQDVKGMLVAYGDDPAIIRQLAEIERDRSDIYRRIIAEI